MHPTICHGDVITVEPVPTPKLKRGDIILYRSQSGFIAHRIVKIKKRNGEGLTYILKGDASATCDEPVETQQVLGKVVFLERNHRIIDPYSLRVRLWGMVYRWLNHRIIDPYSLRVRLWGMVYRWLARLKRAIFYQASINFHPHPNPPPSRGRGL